MWWIVVIVDVIFLGLAFKYILDIVLVIWSSHFYGVPYVPSKVNLLKKLMKEIVLQGSPPDFIEADLQVVELGSGDGRISVWLAKNYPSKVTGYELNRWLLFVSRIGTWLVGKKKGLVRFARRDLFKVNLSRADIVYVYLLPKMLERLGKQFGQMKRGARIISFDYPLGQAGFKLEKEVGGRQKLRMYRKVT